MISFFGLTSGQIVLIIVPFAVVGTMVPIYQWFARLFGIRRGYLAGFIFYWVVWCFLLPLMLQGGSGLINLFSAPENPFGQSFILGIIFLALPPVLAATTAFPKIASKVNLKIILLSAAIALVNGTGEEILWRGSYVANFPGFVILSYFYPAVGFAIWHFAPQTIFPSRYPGGQAAFIFGAFFVGLCWGWVVWQTGSILWTSISHIVFDFLGMGALIYYVDKNYRFS